MPVSQPCWGDFNQKIHEKSLALCLVPFYLPIAVKPITPNLVP